MIDARRVSTADVSAVFGTWGNRRDRGHGVDTRAFVATTPNVWGVRPTGRSR
jgi:hypothetical protein